MHFVGNLHFGLKNLIEMPLSIVPIKMKTSDFNEKSFIISSRSKEIPKVS